MNKSSDYGTLASQYSVDRNQLLVIDSIRYVCSPDQNRIVTRGARITRTVIDNIGNEDMALLSPYDSSESWNKKCGHSASLLLRQPSVTVCFITGPRNSGPDVANQKGGKRVVYLSAGDYSPPLRRTKKLSPTTALTDRFPSQAPPPAVLQDRNSTGIMKFARDQWVF